MSDPHQPAPPAACYRHPDRATRLACTVCGRPICVECLRTADVGQRCPECAEPPPEARRGPPVVRRSAPVALWLLGMNVGIFVLGFLDAGLGERMFLLGAQFNHLVTAGEYHRVLTAAFLHAGLAHVGFNMLALWIFGPPLEQRAGSGAFAALYLASLLWGSAAFLLAGPTQTVPAVGASGAIFGLFGAWLAVFVRNRHTAIGRTGLTQLLVLLAINTALPLVMPSIAWEAHLGGMLAGFLIAWLWGSRALRRREATGPRAGTALLVGALGVVAVLLVGLGLHPLG